MTTKRIETLKERYLNATPAVSIERLILATEAYKKYAGEAIPIFRARVLEYVLDNMEVHVRPDELIVGAISKFIRGALIHPEYKSNEMLFEELEKISTRPDDPMDMSEENKATAVKILTEYWENKSTREGVGLFSDDAEYAMANDIISVGFLYKSSAETVPNYEKVLKMGLNGYIKQCSDRIKELDPGDAEDYQKILFIRGCKIVCEAVIRFTNRYAEKAEELAAIETDSAKQDDYLKIASNCRNVPANPASNFHEALQAVWLVHTVLHIETATTACSFGRFDQTLYPYLKTDLEEGRITRDEAKELCECFFLKCGEPTKLRDSLTARFFSGFVMWPVVMIGGQDKDGNDATNTLSYICLEAGDELRLSVPLLAMRVHEKTPTDFMEKALRMVQDGLANPGFFNDEVAIDIVKDKANLTVEEARNWFVVGCTQPNPGGGIADGHNDASYVNSAKCLELVLHNGVDPATGRLIGLKTGELSDFTSKAELYEAVKKQVIYFYEMAKQCIKMVQCYHMKKLPVMWASIVTDDCIDKGMSVQEGGARHSTCALFFTGPSNVVDSLIAIEDLVFKDKVLTLNEYVKILDKNFAGNEALRQRILNNSDKFGNDIPYVDELYRKFTNEIADIVQEWKDARGAYFDLTMMTQTVNVVHGKVVGATPDGRKAGEPVADNASPMMGRDINGATATVSSVASMNQRKFKDAALFNLRFDPRGIQGQKGIDVVNGVIRTYFKKGGYHIQINVVSDETLRDAQANPENYRDLVVRVAGYMAYYTELAPDVQDAIMQRTAHVQ